MKKNTGMKYDPDKHHRKSIRLKYYDYSQTGAYFVTIVTQHRQHIFGDIEKGVMIPNSAGEMIESIWDNLSERFPQIELDAFVVMPNHVHGIIVINHQPNHKTTLTPNAPIPVGAGLVPAPAPTPATHKHPLNKNQQMDDKSGFASNDTVGIPTRGIPTRNDTQTPSVANVMDTQTNTLTPLISNDPVGAGLVPAPTPATNQPTLHQPNQTNHETAFISNDAIGIPTRGIPTRTNTSTPFTSNEITNDSKHPTLGDMVGAFKSLTTHAYIVGVRQHGWTPFDKRLWQRNYYEHIIRDDDALMKIRAYIQNNPRNWETDTENKNTGVKP